MVRGSLGNTNVALAVAVVVIVVALRAGLVASTLAALSGALAFDVFQTQPYGSVRIAGTRDTITTLLLVGVGVLAGVLVERERVIRLREQEQGDAFTHLRRFVRRAATETDTANLIAIAEAELSDLLGLVGCRFERAPFNTTLTRLERQGPSRHKLVIHQDDMAPDWGPDREIELPVRGRSHHLGRFVLELPPSRRIFQVPVAAREVAFAVADELGTVLAAAWSAPPMAVSPPPARPA
jgi:K+-sensing histidine kinase KdpD